MKKIHLLLLLPLFFSAACQSSDTIPFKDGDDMDKLLTYLTEKEIRFDQSFYDTTFFHCGNKNYIVTESYDSNSIVKIRGYSNTKLPSVSDFYRLRFGMDIYEVAEIVGAPIKFDHGSNYFNVIYKANDNQYVTALYNNYGHHAIYEDSFVSFEYNGELNIDDD